MKRALEITVPQRMPHVSRLRIVLGFAMFKKVNRSSGGSITVLRGAPPSVNAVGLKVYFDGDCGTGGGDGLTVVNVVGLGGTDSVDFGGIGGA